MREARRAAPRGIGAHLILVGLPGAGKTTVGAAVAAELGWGFLDFDAEIERRVGCSVAELFAARGEAHFRQLELELTDELRARPAMVLAPGGGWITSPAVVARLCPPGRMIYLVVRPETAVRRMGRAVAARPLLAGEDAVGAVRRLLAVRGPMYETADFVVDTEGVEMKELIRRLVVLASPSGGG